MIAKRVRERPLAKGSQISEHKIILAINAIALAYRRDQDIRRQIDRNSELRRAGQLPGWAVRTLKTRGQGQPPQYADFRLIVAAARLLQRMKGHNARIGWGYWNESKETRKKSEIQKFCEFIFELVDPCRSDLPLARYYPEVKERLGLTKPRG